VLDVEHVRAGGAEHRQQAGQLAGTVGDAHPQRQEATARDEAVAQHLRQQQRVDVAARQHGDDRRLERRRILHEGCHRGDAGRLDDELGALGAVQQRARHGVVVDEHDVVDEVAHVGEGHEPGRPMAMPSATVDMAARAMGSPAASDAGQARLPSPARDDAHVGSQPLDRDADAGDQPAATGAHHDRCAPRGTAPALEPDGALPGDDVDVVEGVDEHRARLVREAARHARAPRRRSPRMADPRRRTPGSAATLGSGAAVGHEAPVDGRAEQRRGEGHALRVVAGRRGDDTAGPLLVAQPRDPDVGARILNEPVRWRFSHLSSTGPPTRCDSRAAPAGAWCARRPRAAPRGLHVGELHERDRGRRHDRQSPTGGQLMQGRRAATR
jgi:hypothetical protein